MIRFSATICVLGILVLMQPIRAREVACPENNDGAEYVSLALRSVSVGAFRGEALEYSDHFALGFFLPDAEHHAQHREASVQSAVLTDTSLFEEHDEFLFAGRPRYTIDGSPLLRVSNIKPFTLAATGGMYAGIMIGLHVYQMQTFWQQRSPVFTVIEDGSYAKGVDKFGHVFGSALMCYYSTEVLQASGLSVESAHVWGTLMGMVYQTYVEIEDGYGSNWGFSPSDMYANAAGAAFFLSQYYVPFLQNFSVKWIYTPASWIGESARAEGLTFIDDYSSSTFYLSCKVFNLLPQTAQQWWPRWLNIAAGYAARGLDTPAADAKFILALDYDLPELLPDFRNTVGGTVGDVLNWCKQTLNFVKLPSPSIEFGASGMTRFNLLYPFKLRVAGVTF
ncbi:MAG: DUF2279 domain-containing protein [Candidatus Kapaibacterium sp.]